MLCGVSVVYLKVRLTLDITKFSGKRKMLRVTEIKAV